MYTSLVRKYKHDIVFLYETLVEERWDEVRNCFGADWNIAGILIVGLSGGLVAIWKPSSRDVDVSTVGRQIILYSCVEDGFQWVGCGIYTSTIDVERTVWKTFEKARYLNVPLLAVGDFNVILRIKEVKDLS